MKGQAPDRVRRVSVTDPVAATRRYDYADAFELRLEGPDRCSPEEWVRAGVDATPAWIKRIAGHADGLGSARIVESDADVVVLEDSDPLMDTVMVGRNVEPERRVLTTVLRYRWPLLAQPVWAFVGILHRRTARRVLTGGLRQGDRSGDAVLEQVARDAGLTRGAVHHLFDGKRRPRARSEWPSPPTKGSPRMSLSLRRLALLGAAVVAFIGGRATRTAVQHMAVGRLPL